MRGPRQAGSLTFNISSASSNTRILMDCTLSTRLDIQFFRLPCVPKTTWSTMRVCLQATIT